MLNVDLDPESCRPIKTEIESLKNKIEALKRERDRLPKSERAEINQEIKEKEREKNRKEEEAKRCFEKYLEDQDLAQFKFSWGPYELKETTIGYHPWPNIDFFYANEDAMTYITAGSVAYGEIAFDRLPMDIGLKYNADGENTPAPNNFPAPGLRKYSLIIKIGDKYYQGGRNASFTVMPPGGKVDLIVNDDREGDNSGFWTVSVSQYYIYKYRFP